MLDFDGDVCPRDHHALRDGTCPTCGRAPPVVEDLLPAHDPGEELPGIRGW